MRTLLGAITVMAMLTGSPAYAGPKFIVQPLPVGAERIRFEQGVPTLDLERAHGGVQITPLPIDHGGLSFGIAVYNNGTAPANIDISSFDIVAGTEKLSVFSREQLDGKAKKRAMWASIAVGVAGGLAAAASASQRDHYRSTLVTPHGTYRSYYSAPSVAGQIQATAIGAGTGVALVNIQSQLDQTRQALGNEVVQMTTVDPGDSYAGRIVLNKIKAKTLPQNVAIVVNWNGEAYPFTFRLAKAGTPQPLFPAPVSPVARSAIAPATAGPTVTAMPTQTTVKAN
jgi:hypothetical protein